MEAFLKKKSHTKAAFVKVIKNIKERQVMTLEKSMNSISVGLDKIIAHNELLRNREIEHLKQIETLRAENAKLIAERDEFEKGYTDLFNKRAARIQDLQQKVWVEMDKKSCPGIFMQIAVEAILYHGCEEVADLKLKIERLEAERDMLKLCADHNEDEVKKMMTERKEYLANKILDTSDKKLLDRLLSEREQYENHDVYATLYEDAKALIDPHTKASGGELPTSVIQSFEYLFKFWIERNKAEREAMMKQGVFAVIAKYPDVKEPKILSWNEMPDGEHWVYASPLPAQQIPESTKFLSRSIDWWEQCDPIAMAQMQNGEIEVALVDARHDILWLHKLMTNRVEILHNTISAQQIPEVYEKLLEYWHASRNMYYIGDVSAEKEREYEYRYEKATSAVYAMLSASQKVMYD